jgi:hypothetical protein
MQLRLLRLSFLVSLSACFSGSIVVEDDDGGGGSGGAGASGAGASGAGASGAGASGAGASGAGASGAGGEGGAPCACDPMPGPCQTCNPNAGCVLMPKLPGEPCTGGGGVCQGGAFVEQCGQRISQRPFPAPGTWTFTAVSEVFNGLDSPPPSGIVATEQTTDGTRLFVLRNDGMIYERRNGTWQSPVAASVLFGTKPVAQKVPQMCDEAELPSSSITTMGKGRFGTDEIIILSTNDSPPRAYQYAVEESGQFNIDFRACLDAIPPEDPNNMTNNEAPQHLVGIDWSFGMFVAPFPTTPDSQTTFKVIGGTVYEYWAGNTPSTFIYPYAPVSEAASPLAINGIDDAPAPGSVVAAHYDEVASVLQVIGD